jgi:hypothetical protein
MRWRSGGRVNHAAHGRSDDAPSLVKHLLTLPERRPGATLLAIGALFALAYGASLVYLPKPDGRIVRGDAVHQYVQLRSMVFDRDLHFENEYVQLYNLTGREPENDWVYMPTATGHVRNYMAVGAAIFWAPAFLAVSAAVWVANALGASYPFDGYGRIFQATAGFSGIIAAVLGSWLTFLTAASLFDRRSAIWATLTIWLASSAIYYSLISPTYSHVTSMFAVSLFWLVWVRTMDRQTPGRYAVIGLLAGVATLMRWQDAVLLILPALDVLWHRGPARLSSLASRLAACGAGALVGFAPQMAFWAIVYGQPLAIPQGPEFMKWTEPALWLVLFSAYHGLLTWTPVIAIALVGLVALVQRNRFIGLSAIAFFCVAWYVNAAVADWWAGEAFGARRFLSCYPIFVLGLTALFDRFRTRALAVPAFAIASVGYTLLLLVQYQAYMHGLRDLAPYPGGPYTLWLARFRVPFDLIGWWMNRS